MNGVKAIRPYREARGTGDWLTRGYVHSTKIAIMLPKEMFEVIREGADRRRTTFAHEARRLLELAIAAEEARDA